MFFLIRMAFWLSVVLVLLPSGGAKQTAAAPSAEIGAVEAVSAASATVGDMRQFCTRQPEACALGSQAAVAFGQRAQAGAKMVYELINERATPRETGSIATKGAKPAVTLAAKPSQNTLTPADLAPAWRGAHREAHNQHGV
jgi:hypothetical protein